MSGLQLRSLLFLAALVAVTPGLLEGCGSNAASKPPTVAYRLAWTTRLKANADNAPRVVTAPLTPEGPRRTLLLVLAGNNRSDCEPGNPVRQATIYVFLAHSGKLLWQRSMKGPARCTTSSPVVSRGFVYSPGLDGAVHRYQLSTGKEYVGPAAGVGSTSWPEPFTRSPYVEKASSPLTASWPYLYVSTSGYTGHPGRYQGHLVTINLMTGARSVWNSLCSNLHVLLSPSKTSTDYCSATGAGIWARTGVEIDPITHHPVVVTGNGPWNGRTNWGDSIVELSRDGRNIVGTFTPSNVAYLGTHDADLGSSGPAILPPVRWRGVALHLAVQGGKGPLSSAGGPAVLRLLDRSRWTGGPGHIGGQLDSVPAPGGCAVLTAPAVWPHASIPSVIYANDCGISSYHVVVSASGVARLIPNWHLTSYTHHTSPVIAGGLLYVAQSGSIDVYDPATGKKLWSSSSVSSRRVIGSLHWEYPAVAGQWLFMTDEAGRLYAFRRV